MEGDFGLSESDLDVLGMSGAKTASVAIGGGTTAALTIVTRLAAPVGSGIHRHAPALAAVIGAATAGALTKSFAGVAASLIVGGSLWLTERLLEYQAKRLLPYGS